MNIYLVQTHAILEAEMIIGIKADFDVMMYNVIKIFLNQQHCWYWHNILN